MSEEQTQEKQHWIVYPLGSKPKWPLAVLLGIQQYLTMFGATVLIPFIVGGAMGLPPEQLALMISTIFFTSGLCTLIQQSPLGNKLPVIQGGTFSFLGPTKGQRYHLYHNRSAHPWRMDFSPMFS